MAYALITGASEGLGKAMAMALAKKGHDLFLISRNKDKLHQLCENISSAYQIKCLYLSMDLAKDNAPDFLYEHIKNTNLQIDILINNACNYVRGPFEVTNELEEVKIITLQCSNLIRITKLLIPILSNSPNAKILNVGSTGSFVPGPYNAVYCAAKAFVLSFSQAIYEELKPKGISVSTLCPGGIETNLQSAYPDRKGILFNKMTPEKVAEVGISQLLKNKRMIIPGLWNKIQVNLIKFLPGKTQAALSGKLTLISGLKKKNLVVNT